MDNFYTRKAQLLSKLCDALAEVQELSVQISSHERSAADPDEELRSELKYLHLKAHDFEKYAAGQYMAAEPLSDAENLTKCPA